MQARRWVEDLEGHRVVIDRREGETSVMVGEDHLFGIRLEEELTKPDALSVAAALIEESKEHVEETDLEPEVVVDYPKALHRMWRIWIEKMFHFGSWGRGNQYYFPGNRIRHWQNSARMPYEELTDQEKKNYEGMAKELFGG